ncbi:MAG: hypothetical protein J6W08_02450 [Alphaproteobacteria bacterium]|nr:hypothetical protein [Alphaproteobacteria bacterium]
MKKYLVLALLLVPTVSFAAPSVRVLGSGSGTTASSATGTKITPAKTANVSKAAATNTGRTASGSRIGTVRAMPKVGSGTVSTTASGTASRFPVITPAHSYSSVTKPQTASGTTINVDLDNYYNKEEVNNIINALKEEDDPRIDAIRLVDPSTPGLHTKDLPSDYVYMWIEE